MLGLLKRLVGIVDVKEKVDLPTIDFPRKIIYPELENLGQYINDIFRGEFAFEGKYRKTFTATSLPLHSREPRRSYSRTRTSNLSGAICTLEGDLAFDVLENTAEQGVVFTGLQFKPLHHSIPFTPRDGELINSCKRCVEEYFRTYKVNP